MKPSFFAGWAATAACFLLAACSGGGDTTKSDEPTTFQVGRTSIEWTDPTRNEQCGGVPAGTRRRLQAYVWYPAQPAVGASREPLLSAAQVELLASGIGATPDSLMRLPSTSYAEAPVDASRATYPVLVMSHAAGGSSPLFYASTAEYLAARGYVVVGLSHSYNALATFFADGTVLPADPACDVDGAPVAIGPGATAADFEANWQFELNLDAYLAQDIASLVRQLGQLNETHPRFAGRLQVRNVGAFGHSFCGSHAFRAARDLPEIAAAANLDGTVFNENAAEGVRKPYLMIGGLDTHPSTSDIQLAIAQYQALGLTADEAALQVSRALPGATFLASRPAYPVTIPSAQHMNFSDVGLWAAYGIPVDADPVNLSGAQAIVGLQNSMLTRFFDLNLRGIGGELSLPASSLAGLTLEARR